MMPGLKAHRVTHPLPPSSPTCSICGQAVILTSTKTDERGDTVREDCYISNQTKYTPVCNHPPHIPL